MALGDQQGADREVGLFVLVDGQALAEDPSMADDDPLAVAAFEGARHRLEESGFVVRCERGGRGGGGLLDEVHQLSTQLEPAFMDLTLLAGVIGSIVVGASKAVRRFRRVHGTDVGEAHVCTSAQFRRKILTIEFDDSEQLSQLFNSKSLVEALAALDAQKPRSHYNIRWSDGRMWISWWD